MYRIAVCEDEKSFLKTNSELAKQALNELHIDGSVTEFDNADDLLSAFEHEVKAFDLLLLDILMDDVNGIDMAKKLRKRGITADIAFITSSDEFLRDGYSVQPINYLFKPVKYADIVEVIKTSRRKIEVHTVTFKQGNSALVLEISDIIYIEVYDHKLKIHLTYGEKIIACSLNNALEILPSEMFARCHNSYAVNLSYVTELTRGSVFIRGQSIPVSRSYYDNMKIALVNYLL